VCLIKGHDNETIYLFFGDLYSQAILNSDILFRFLHWFEELLYANFFCFFVAEYRRCHPFYLFSAVGLVAHRIIYSAELPIHPRVLHGGESLFDSYKKLIKIN